MSKIRGQHFRLFVDSAAVPEETNVSITLSGNTEDTSSKDTEGLYAKEDVVSTAWRSR